MWCLDPRKRSIGVRSLGVGALSVLGSACSPAQLFGGAEDTATRAIPHYRETPAQCQGLRLGESPFQPETFRSLLKCMNREGVLTPVEQWTSSLTDQDLAQILAVFERVWVDHRELRKTSLKRYIELEQSGALVDVFQTLSQVLKEPAMLASASRWISEFTWSADERVFATRWAKGGQFAADLSGLSKVLDAPATVRLVKNLSAPRNRVAALELVNAIRAYATKLQSNPKLEDFLTRIVARISTGELGRVLLDPAVLGSTPDEIRAGASRMVGLFSALSANQKNGSSFFKNSSELMNAFRSTISCVQGAQEIKKGPSQVLAEFTEYTTEPHVRDFLIRDNVLSIVWLNSMCDLPEALSKNYGGVIEFARGPWVFELHRFLRALPAGIREDLIDVFSNSGDEVVALIQALERTGVLPDLLLVLVSENEAGAAHWRGLAQDLVKSGKLRGLWSAASSVSLAAWQELLDSMDRRQTAAVTPFLKELARVQKIEIAPDSALAELIVEWITALGNPSLRASTGKAFVRALAMPEAAVALRHLGSLSADGRLAAILTGSARLFLPRGTELSSQVWQNTPAVADEGRRHRLSSADLSVHSPVEPKVLNPPSSCATVSLKFRLGTLVAPDYDQNLASFLGCLNGTGDYNKLVEGLMGLRRFKVTGPAGSTDLYQAGVHWLKAWYRDLDPAQARGLSKTWIRALEQGKVTDLLQGFGTLLASRSGGGIRESVVDLGKLVEPHRREMKDATSAISQLIRSPYLPGALRAVTLAPQPPTPGRLVPEIDRASLVESVKKFECDQFLSVSNPLKRLETLNNGFKLGLTQEGRLSWNDSDLEEALRPVAMRLSAPRASGAEQSVLEAFSRFVGTFTLKPAEPPSAARSGTPQDFVRWWLNRASDVRIIPYITEGESHPRARQVSVLDAMEMLLLNADIEVFGKHFAVYFIDLLAESWGDVPRALWPLEIRAKYPAGSKPPTIHATMDEIEKTLVSLENWVGYPELPSCLIPSLPAAAPGRVSWLAPAGYQRAVFNIRQVFSMIRENEPGSDSVHAGGLGVLRGLFHHLRMATAPEARGARGGIENQIRVLIDIVKLGGFRNLTRIAQGLDGVSEDELTDAFGFVANLAASRDGQHLLRTVMASSPAALLDVFRVLKSEFEQNPARLLSAARTAFLGLSWVEQKGGSRWRSAIVSALLQDARTYLSEPGVQVRTWLSLLDSSDLQSAIRRLRSVRVGADQNDLLAWVDQALMGSEAIEAPIRSILRFASRVARDPRASQVIQELIAGSRHWASKNSAFVERVWTFFMNEGSPGSEGADTLRALFAELLSSRDGQIIDVFLEVVRDEPETISILLEGFESVARSGELGQFLERATRHLSLAP